MRKAFSKKLGLLLAGLSLVAGSVFAGGSDDEVFLNETVLPSPSNVTRRSTPSLAASGSAFAHHPAAPLPGPGEFRRQHQLGDRGARR